MNSISTSEDLENLFKSLNVQIYRYIYVHIGYSKELTEDLAQEVFMKVWENRNKYDSKKSTLKNWTYHIAKNLCIDHLRTKKKTFSLEDFDYIDDENINEAVENKELLKEILTNLQYLKIEERDLVILRYIQELELNEIADVKKKSYEWVKLKIHRAIKKLRVLIEKNGK